jgi:hypothetical protein
MRTGDYAMENPDGTYIYTADRLEAVVLEYSRFLNQGNVMPRAAAGADQIIERTLFELAYRDGLFSDETTKHEDELCQDAA